MENSITVKELIEMLKGLPQDYRVMIQTCEFYAPITKDIDVEDYAKEVVLYEHI